MVRERLATAPPFHSVSILSLYVRMAHFSTGSTYHDAAMSRADHIVAADKGGGRALRRVAPAGRALVPPRQAEGRLCLPTFGRGGAGADCEKGDGNKEWPPCWEVPHHLGAYPWRSSVWSFGCSSSAATTAVLGGTHLGNATQELDRGCPFLEPVHRVSEKMRSLEEFES